MDDLQIAVNAIQKAAIRIKEISASEILIDSSVGKDIKLKADKESENILINYISRYSDYPLLSEEMTTKIDYRSNDFIWIIDPLDGSLNFSRGIPFYCISIGLWKNSKPILGVIYDLVGDKLYTGSINEGAFCGKESIATSNITAKSKAVISTGFPVYSSFDTDSLTKFIGSIQQFKKVRLFGSAAMSITLVAGGIIDAYSEDNIAIWDVAGALAILTAAGGKFSLSQGKDMNLVNIFATNGKIEIENG